MKLNIGDKVPAFKLMSSDKQPITHETIVQGMGQTHIEVAVHHLHNKFGVDVDTTMPRVPYRETITRHGQSRYRHRKQTGGAGQFAEIELAVEPGAPGSGYEMEWKVVGGSISRSYETSIDKGIRQRIESGVIAGYPVYDVKVRVLDGKEHAVDSKPMAFEIAARTVFREAFEQAGPVLLEPLYHYEITVPEANSGDVMSNLKTKRGQVLSMVQEGSRMIITAEAPLAEMQKYATDLRSITQGRGRFTLQFNRYAAVPAQLASVIMAKHKAELAAEKDD